MRIEPFRPAHLRRGRGEEVVVLLHGLARLGRSMRPLARRLAAEGYRALIVDYPSTRYGIEHLAETVVPQAVQAAGQEGAGRLHFVTHSLGGILVRYYLREHRIDRLGRVVMLSPPNQGSEVVDRLRHLALFRLVNGPAGGQLGTDPESLPNRLGPVGYEVGVITGCRCIEPYFAPLFPGPSDGKVSVERARLEGMTDFLVVPHSHTFIVRSPLVIRQTVHFLAHGRFDRAGAAGP